VLVTSGKVGSGGGDAGFRIAGNGGVAIKDKVMVRSDAGGVDLSDGETCEEDREDDCPFAYRVAEQASDRNAKSWSAKIANGHDCTSLLR